MEVIWLERPVTPGVAGSSPVRSATNLKGLPEWEGLFAFWRLDKGSGNKRQPPGLRLATDNSIPLCCPLCLSRTLSVSASVMPLTRSPVDRLGFFRLHGLLFDLRSRSIAFLSRELASNRRRARPLSRSDGSTPPGAEGAPGC